LEPAATRSPMSGQEKKRMAVTEFGVRD
jgi:hypothetical protein